MRTLSVILILCLFTGVAYSQESQTQPVKPEEPEKPAQSTYDENKPTIIFYLNGQNEQLKDFIQTVTAGMANLANFAALDTNDQTNADKKRNILSQYKVKGVVDVLCVIGKGQETDVILGQEHIAQYLSAFFRYYANPKIFPAKPNLQYEHVETIADKFEAVLSKFDEYKKLFEAQKKHITDTIEGQPEDKQLASLIGMIILSILYGLGIFKKKK